MLNLTPKNLAPNLITNTIPDLMPNLIMPNLNNNLIMLIM